MLPLPLVGTRREATEDGRRRARGDGEEEEDGGRRREEVEEGRERREERSMALWCGSLGVRARGQVNVFREEKKGWKSVRKGRLREEGERERGG